MSSAQLDHAGRPALSAMGLSRAFGGIKVATDVSFDVELGTITALIGPNGAGKTTLFNLITNIFRSETGRVELFGESIRGWSPEKIAASGLIRTFQSARVFPGMTTIENVLCGGHRLLKSGITANMLRLAHARNEERGITRRAEQLLELIGLSRQRDVHATELPMGSQKMLEVVRALMAEPRVLLLDEPAAGLNDSETAELAALLSAIRLSGVTILLVEHNMSLVMNVADQVIVLEAGKIIARGKPSDIQNNQRVIGSYLGSQSLDEPQ